MRVLGSRLNTVVKGALVDRLVVVTAFLVVLLSATLRLRVK